MVLKFITRRHEFYHCATQLVKGEPMLREHILQKQAQLLNHLTLPQIEMLGVEFSNLSYQVICSRHVLFAIDVDLVPASARFQYGQAQIFHSPQDSQPLSSFPDAVGSRALWQGRPRLEAETPLHLLNLHAKLRNASTQTRLRGFAMGIVCMLG